MQDTHNESALEMRLKQLKKYMTLGLVGVLALCGLMFMYMSTLKQSENVAQTNQQTQAQTAIDSDVCKVYPDQELCVLARKIAANPDQAVTPKDGKDGAQGETGATGRGVASFATTLTGDLTVTYTDGATDTIGHVVGKNGIDGTDGEDGRGILAATVESGSLIVRYSDGTSQNLGIVVGPAGADGATGPAGPAGINGTNGTNGIDGKDGISVVDLKVDSTGTVTVYYSNDTSATAGKVIVSAIKSMTCNIDSNTLTITSMDGSAVSATVDCSPDNVPNLNATTK
jgi:hypothetical protein